MKTWAQSLISLVSTEHSPIPQSTPMLGQGTCLLHPIRVEGNVLMRVTSDGNDNRWRQQHISIFGVDQTHVACPVWWRVNYCIKTSCHSSPRLFVIYKWKRLLGHHSSWWTFETIPYYVITKCYDQFVHCSKCNIQMNWFEYNVRYYERREVPSWPELYKKHLPCRDDWVDIGHIMNKQV